MSLTFCTMLKQSYPFEARKNRIDFVILNGQIVVSHGERTDKFCGKVIRKHSAVRY
ncbi:hypothetical protein KKE26_00890 [bacterium]|nr:hypothetical protein [bacterium]